ncbi:hypothetical protein OG936_26655 [Streptomyces sp. NBC_00846]|uniref:hypothetical protein n=1 Tax=Streptomyces sp. NBC_00846 TaxID=2975849 RepID=UPI00386F985C|nr:hypothetical protein OG936_26655 [Streptomyces sp. NBC_00846]
MSDYLAVYVPKYPGRGNKYISGEQITRYLTGVRGLPATGHARAEDATRTAWILVNRYSLPSRRGTRSPGSTLDRKPSIAAAAGRTARFLRGL